MENTFTVKGMSCEHCKKSVEKALNSLKGIKNIDVDLKQETVTIEHDKSVTFKKMKNIVKNAGYKLIKN